MRNRFTLLAATAVLLPLTLSVGPCTQRGRTAGEFQDVRKVNEASGISEYVFRSNGLRVLVYEDHVLPIATFAVAYGAGARDDAAGQTGTAHFLEHLMFRGSKHFNKSLNTDVKDLLQSVGAEINGATSSDQTQYMTTLPSAYLSLAIEIEADRMRGLLLNAEDVERERNIILNERNMLTGRPKRMLEEAVWGAAYPDHPYGRPAIGTLEDLECITADEIRAFYDAYYQPNNAVIAVTGDVDTDFVLAEIARFFRPIPHTPVPPPPAAPGEDRESAGRGTAVPSGAREVKTESHLYPPPTREPAGETAPVEAAPREVILYRNDLGPHVIVAHKAPPMIHKDADPLKLLARVLTSGRTSRLYRALIDTGLANTVEVHPPDRNANGLFSVEAAVSDDMPPEDVRDVILATYRDLAEGGVTEIELARAKNLFRSEYAFEWDGPEAAARAIQAALAGGDWTYFPELGRRIDAVTAEDIKQVVKTILVPERITVGFLLNREAKADSPSSAPSEAAVNESTEAAVPPVESAPRGAAEQLGAREPKTESRLFPQQPSEGKISVTSFSLAGRAASLDVSGIRVTYVPTSLKDVFVIEGSIDGVGEAYGERPWVARLTAEMLTEATEGFDKREIAERLADRGAGIAFSAGPERLRFSARGFSSDLPFVLDILARLLRRPAFLPDDFEHLRNRALATVKENANAPGQYGHNIISRLVYPPGHPGYRRAFEDQMRALEELSLDRVRAFYDAHYGKNDVILITAGSVDEAVLYEAVRRAFGGWPAREMLAGIPRHVLTGGAPVTRSKFVPDKSSVVVTLALPLAVTRESEDYLPLHAASFILGGNFSSRLVMELRERRGLVYAAHADINGVARNTQGMWRTRFAAAPADLDTATARAREELARLARGGVTEAELERAKSTLRGLFLVGLKTTGALASEILRAEELGLGLSYLDRYPGDISALTTAEVNNAVSRYILPERFHLAAVGNVESHDAR